MATLLLTFAIIGSLFVAFNNGANDVANAFASAVGSKALKVKHALFVAACLNFIGAIVLGANVSKMLVSGVVNVGNFGDVNGYIAGMLACMVASGTFMFVSTQTGLPVSSTHSIVGSMIGVYIFSGGVDTVNWKSFSILALTWMLTPFLSALCSFSTIKLIRYTIYSGDRDKIMERAYKWIPLFVSIIIVAVIIAVAHGTRFGSCLSRGNSILALVVIFFVFYVALKKFTKFLTTKFSNREFGIEHVFKRFQAGTSCLIGFAVGSNDVANSVTPIVAIYFALKLGHVPTSSESFVIPVWLLALGGLGMSVGVLSFGRKVISTLGHGITVLTNSKGFAIDFSTAMTIIVASVFGIPVSSTHASTGSVIGVGLEKGIHNVNFGIILRIFATWLITVPLSAIFAIVVFKFFLKVASFFA